MGVEMISARTTRSRRWRWLVGGVATLATVLAVASCATSTPEMSYDKMSDFMTIPCKPLVLERQGKYSEAMEYFQGEMKETEKDKRLAADFTLGCYMWGRGYLLPDMKTVRIPPS